MQKINFLHPEFQTNVSTSCIAEDGYQPTNLISADYWEKDRGFMAYSVTKPPVTLTFNLQFKISIERLKIWPALGSLRSTGFEILVYDGEEFLLAAKYKRPNASTIEFTSNREESDGSSSTNEKVSFYSTARVSRALKYSNSIQIKITSTKSCPAVLSKVEIWGYPSKQLSESDRQTCHQLWNNFITLQRISKNTVASTKLSNATCKMEIPEEYLDSITYEIMQFPMRLPCGKVVDQSTVERHSAIESSWGRQTSDPFTGKQFTDRLKPLLDTALKCRIDKFLIENANHEDLKSVPRTLGTNPSKMEVTKYRSCSDESYSPCVKKYKTESTKVGIPKVIPIEDAMRLALNSIRQRSYIHQGTSKSTSQLKCSTCDTINYLYKVKICEHLFCRQCLSRRTESKVCFCDTPFENSDVQRIFQ